MKAIYRNKLYVVIEDAWDGVTLEPINSGEADQIFVPFKAHPEDLIIDPTDDELLGVS